MGGAKEAGRFLPRLESDTHRSAVCKMMGFAKGSTHPTGCDDPAGFVEAVIEE
jgi:hypothetical protein